MARMKPIKLRSDERSAIEAPEFISGPSWANRPVWLGIEQSATQ